MAYGYFKDLARRTDSDKILFDKVFNIGKYLRYNGYHRGLGLMVYKLIDKKASGNGIKKWEYFKQIAEELRKPFIRKFKKRKKKLTYYRQNLGADLTDIKLISKANKGFRFSLCVIDIYSKYVCVIPLKYKKGITITNAFRKILKESDCKPNKIWVDTHSEFYDSSMNSWWEKDDIEMYSVVAERFIRTLKNRNYKYMTSIS